MPMLAIRSILAPFIDSDKPRFPQNRAEWIVAGVLGGTTYLAVNLHFGSGIAPSLHGRRSGNAEPKQEEFGMSHLLTFADSQSDLLPVHLSANA
jgi:hypothetical protein